MRIDFYRNLRMGINEVSKEDALKMISTYGIRPLASSKVVVPMEPFIFMHLKFTVTEDYNRLILKDKKYRVQVGDLAVFSKDYDQALSAKKTLEEQHYASILGVG